MSKSHRADALPEPHRASRVPPSDLFRAARQTRFRRPVHGAVGEHFSMVTSAPREDGRVGRLAVGGEPR